MITVITGRGAARPDCPRNDGGILRQAERSNNNTYREVIDSGLGRLCCLGVEVFGRWSEDPLQIVSALARERTRCLPIRIRRGVELALLQRWWGLLGVSVQRLVAITASRDSGEDLIDSSISPLQGIADLPSAL